MTFSLDQELGFVDCNWIKGQWMKDSLLWILLNTGRIQNSYFSYFNIIMILCLCVSLRSIF